MFFWSDKTVHFFDLDKSFTNLNLVALDVSISPQEKVKIKEIVPGNNKNKIAIIIESLNENFTILSWVVPKNYENEAFNVVGDFKIIWGSNGNFYIATRNNSLIFTNMRT